MMQKLFDHMEQEHGLILTESELQDIVSAVGMDVRLLLSRMTEERDGWKAYADKLEKVARDLGGYALTVRTDRPDKTLEFRLQTLDWCVGLLDEAKAADLALALRPGSR